MERQTPIDKARESIPYIEHDLEFRRQRLIEDVRKHAKRFHDQAETFERIAKRMETRNDEEIVRDAHEVAHDVAWFTATLGTHYLSQKAGEFSAAVIRLAQLREFTAPEATKPIPPTTIELLNELLLCRPIKVRGKYVAKFGTNLDGQILVTFRHRKYADTTALQKDELDGLLSQVDELGLGIGRLFRL